MLANACVCGCAFPTITVGSTGLHSAPGWLFLEITLQGGIQQEGREAKASLMVSDGYDHQRVLLHGSESNEITIWLYNWSIIKMSSRFELLVFIVAVPIIEAFYNRRKCTAALDDKECPPPTFKIREWEGCGLA